MYRVVIKSDFIQVNMVTAHWQNVISTIVGDLPAEVNQITIKITKVV